MHVTHSRRRWAKAETDHLIALVERVCKKLDEEKQQGKSDVAQLVSFGHRGIPILGKELRELVNALQGTQRARCNALSGCGAEVALAYIYGCVTSSTT